MLRPGVLSSIASFVQLGQLLPQTYRVLQIINSALHQPARAVAQPAHQPVMASEETAAALASQAAKQASSVLTAAYTPPSGVKKTFYKRKLPCPPATEFSSAEGRLLFSEALQQGTMTGFFKLIEQYSTQDEPAFCGLASIAMVLNALSIDPKRPWKGSWRWFHEQLLDCCLPLNTVAKEGVVLTQAACLAKCNGANVTLHRSGSFTLDQFRAAVAEVCSSGEEHIVVSYSRKAFSQTGDGHFSPVGGYHSGRDLVLILDTARFKYPPHWVPLPMLFEAMAALDPTTGLARGFLRLSANTRPDSVLFTLDIRPDASWREAEHFIKSTAPQLVQAAAAGEAFSEPLIQRLAALAPLDSVVSFIAMRYAAQMCARDRCVPHTVRQQVLQELRATPLHQMLQPLLAKQLSASQAEQQQQQQQQDFLSEKLTMLLLLQEPGVWGAPAAWSDQGQYKAWQQLLDASSVSIVEGEVQYLRQQLLHIDDVLRGGSRDQPAAAAAAAGNSSGAGGAGRSSTASVCSTCPFQLDCQVKGCIKGDLEQGVTGAAVAATGGHNDQQQQHGSLEGAPAAAAGAVAREQAGWQQHRSTQQGGQQHACCNHH